MDLLLDRNNHDLVFVNGECPTTGDMVDVVTQRLYIRLRTFLGEWYLNYKYGVPWLEKVLGHKTKKSSVDMVVQEQILGVRGVARIVHFESQYSPISRAYTCKFRVQVEGGGTTDTIEIVGE